MRYASPDTLVRLNVGDGDLSERWFQFSIGRCTTWPAACRG